MTQSPERNAAARRCADRADLVHVCKVGPDEETAYACEDCADGVLTLKRYGMFVIGSCNGCGREVEFELPEEAAIFPLEDMA